MKRIVILTGATGKLGQNIVNNLSNQYSFVLLVRNKAKAKSIFGKSQKIIEVDLSKQKNTIDIICKISKEINVYAIINNAALDIDNSFFDTTIEQFENIIQVNMKAPYLIIRQILPILIANRFGRIINISSTLSLRTVNNAVEYSMTKSALESLSRSIAVQYGKYGITANNVLINGMLGELRKVSDVGDQIYSPCEADYRMDRKFNVSNIPLDRNGDFREFVSVIKFLLSDDSSYVNGTNIIVDGGKNSWRGNM